MHLEQHVEKIMRIRKLIMKELGYEYGNLSGEMEQALATYTLAAVTQQQLDILGDTVSHLDKP